DQIVEFLEQIFTDRDADPCEFSHGCSSFGPIEQRCNPKRTLPRNTLCKFVLPSPNSTSVRFVARSEFMTSRSLIFTLLVYSAVPLARAADGSISGRLTDPQGKSVAGAKL